MSDQLTPVEELSYEQAFAELEALLTVLEANDDTLDDLLAKFERGQQLAAHCAALLEKAELKVQQLVGDELQEFTPGS